MINKLLSNKEKEILKTFARIMPELTELEKEKLLSYGEGIAFKTIKNQGKLDNLPNNLKGM